MKAHNCCDVKSRFDIVAISIQGDVKHIEVVKDAFEVAYG